MKITKSDIAGILGAAGLAAGLWQVRPWLCLIVMGSISLALGILGNLKGD